MSLKGKIQRVRSTIHIHNLRRENRFSNFEYNGDMLSSKVNIGCDIGSKCVVEQIWA